MARRHATALAAGALLSAAALLPPVNAFADQRLSLHMLEQMLLLAGALPLLAYGAAPLIRLRPTLLHLVAGILSLNLVLFGWQVPAVIELAHRSLAIREAIELAFIVGGTVFWWPIVSPRQVVGGLSPAGKIGYLMVAGVPPTIPGITLAFSRHLFYPAYRSIEDQQVAGLLLFGTAKLALIGGAFVVLWRMLAPDTEPPDQDSREWSEPDPQPSAPAWLRRLDEPLPAEPAAPRPVAARR
jgi:putative membrane protein